MYIMSLKGMTLSLKVIVIIVVILVVALSVLTFFGIGIAQVQNQVLSWLGQANKPLPVGGVIPDTCAEGSCKALTGCAFDKQRGPSKACKSGEICCVA